MSTADPMDFFADLIQEGQAPLPRRAMPAEKLVVEPCSACGGTGVWVGTYGYGVRKQCFKCKGTGKLTFKSTAAERQASRDYSRARKVKQSATIAEKRVHWVEANPMEAAWLEKKNGTWEFATSLAQALAKYGYLTEGQLGGIRKCIQRDAERTATKVAETSARQASAPVVSIAAVETAFETAMSKGIKRPKMRLASFKLSLAPATGANAGAVYVKEGENYLGKVKDGRFFRSFTCTTETEAQIVEVCSDPKNAAIAYGRRTGSCAICARELTNHASIDLGIGPICAEKYGW